MASNESQENQQEVQESKPKRFTRKEVILGTLGGLAGLGVIGFGLKGIGESFQTVQIGGKKEPQIKGGMGGGNPDNTTFPQKTEIKQAISPEETLKVLENLESKIQNIYQTREKWVFPYFAQDGNSLTVIAEKHHVSLTKLQEKNPGVGDFIYLGQRINIPANPVPTPALGEKFDLVKEYHAKIQKIIRPGGNYSLEENSISGNTYYVNLNTAPGINKPFQQTQTEPIGTETAETTRVAQEIKAFINLFPNLGQIVDKFYVGSIPKLGKDNLDAYTYTYKDHSAEIYVSDHPITMREDPNKDTWSKNMLAKALVHELFHAVSFYSNGYNLNLVSLTELINFVSEATQIQDKIYSLGLVRQSKYWSEEESDATFAGEQLLSNLYKNPDSELTKARMDLLERWLSKQLGENWTLANIGEKLNLRID
ncbi:MAG: LysM peptidoglycan-binding domain-containing protein [Candidatus Daviesbacteria bacterium]